MTKTKGKWIHTQALGTLFLEQVLVYFDVPELFVCTDADDRRYLVVFVDDDTLRYVAVPISDATLTAMLQGDITMKQAFLRADGGVAFNIHKDFSVGGFVAERTAIHEIPDEDLPDESGYYHMYTDDVRQYCEQLQEQSDLDELRVEPAQYHWTDKGTFVASTATYSTAFTINVQESALFKAVKTILNSQYSMVEVLTYGEEPVSVYQSDFTSAANAA